MDSYTAPRWSSSALLTIDMQKDFTHGANAVFGTQAVVANVAELAALYRQHGLPIFHAIRFYDSSGGNAELCRRTRISAGHSIVTPSSAGAALVDELVDSNAVRLEAGKLQAGEFQPIGLTEHIFYKRRWSAFFCTSLVRRLWSFNVDTLVVCGCNFPNCPTATLFDASSHDFRAVLATDATSMIDQAGIDRIQGIGVEPMKVGEIMEAVRGAVKPLPVSIHL